MDCTAENYKTIAALVRQEASRLEKMGMTPSEARKTACLIVGDSLDPAIGGAELNSWLSAQMRTYLPKKENGEMTLFGTGVAGLGITVAAAQFPHVHKRGKTDERRVAMHSACEHMKPGETIMVSSTDEKMLRYMQQYMKHLAGQLNWGEGKSGSYQSTMQLNADGKTFDLYVQRIS